MEMELVQALAIAESCENSPIDTLDLAERCIKAIKISLDATDAAVFGPPEFAMSGVIVLLAVYVLRQSFKLARLQGEFAAYRAGKG